MVTGLRSHRQKHPSTPGAEDRDPPLAEAMPARTPPPSWPPLPVFLLLPFHYLFFCLVPHRPASRPAEKRRLPAPIIFTPAPINIRPSAPTAFPPALRHFFRESPAALCPRLRVCFSPILFPSEGASERERKPTRAGLRLILAMSPPTNGAISLAYGPATGAGALHDPLLLPFDDGFTDEDLLGADAALLGGAAGDQTLLLLPLCPGANGCGGSGSASAEGFGAQAAPTSRAVTTPVAAADAGSFSLAPQPAPAPVSWGVATAAAAGSFSLAPQPAPAPISWEVVTADAADGGSPAPAPPSPALPLVHNTGSRTSIYRGVTRYVSVRGGRQPMRLARLSVVRECD
jgi:hypothetical protein